MAWLVAKSQGGKIVLRIEDLDKQRSKWEYVDALQRDLEALGLFWDEGPYFQNDRDEAYREAFARLRAKGLTYPCFCTRADLHAASAPHAGERVVYAGTCSNLTDDERRQKRELAGRTPAERLRVSCKVVEIDDGIQGHFAQNLETECGDFLVRRSDGAFAYQLAVVVDDAEQGINCVVRGVDLLSSSPQQRFLQDVLGLPHVDYYHVPLLVAEDGRRLSKRDKDAYFDVLMERFGYPEALIGHIAGITGIASSCAPASPQELLGDFDMGKPSELFANRQSIVWR